MRIVGGQFRGRTLVAPAGDATRPTTDRTRESLFNILTHHPEVQMGGARVLDLFAGTGAMGLEALSRGAAAALFVEMGSEARGALRANVHALGVQGVAKIFRRDATKLGHVGTMKAFDMVFLDPPYGRGLAEKALRSAAGGGWLRDGALAIVEEANSAEFKLPDGFAQLDERTMGITALRIVRFQA